MDNLESRIERLTREQRALLELRMSRDAARRGGTDPIRPRAPGEEPCASFAQERLWFLDRLSPGDPYYNEPLLAIRLTGALHRGAMQRSLDEIVCRHETLRTTFASPHGQARPVIHPPASVETNVVDLGALPAGAREAAVAHLANLESVRPFDLSAGPLLRITLIRCGTEDHVLFVAAHHVVSDGWSLRVLLGELAALYDAFRRGHHSPLAPLPVQYADYAAWQRRRLQGPYLDTLIAYWKTQLASAPAELRLPADRRRPRTRSHRGRAVGGVLDAGLTRSLRELGKRRGCTLYMVLLAAFEALLHRYSGQDEFLLGTPVAGRDSPEVEGLIGFFVNTLVIRADVSGDPPFLELLDRVRATVVESLARDELPFEKLVEVMRPARDPSQHPIFNVMFAHHNFAVRTYAVSDLSLRRIEVPSSDAKFDLVLLTVEEENEAVDARLAYSTDVFDAVTIEAMWQRLLQVLTGIVEQPAARVSQLRMTGITGQPDPAAAGGDVWRPLFPVEGALAALFEAQAERRPDADALIHGDRRMTFAQVNARANQIARLLIRRGVGPETIVAMCLERDCDALVCILAILKAGGAYLPLDPTHPPERNRFVLEHAGARLLLTAAYGVDLASGIDLPAVFIDLDAAGIDAEDRANPGVAVAPDNLAYVMYTSGTSGQPKGVAVPHRTVKHIVEWQTRNLRVTPASRLAQIGSLCFDGSVGELYVAFANGAALVLLDPAAITPEALMQAIVAHDLTDFAAVPSLLRVLNPDMLPASNRLTVVSIGEACPVELALKWSKRCRFGNGYGPTETTVASHFWTADAETLATATSVPIGPPICNATSYILDESLRPVADGEIGELFTGGAGVARGYLNNPGLTAERFLPDPFSGRPGSRMYRTGDLVRCRRDGALEFIARRDQQVKLRGYRIEVSEIEHALGLHPAVEQVAVVASDGKAEDRRLTAYLVDRLEHEMADVDLAHVAEWREVMESLGGGGGHAALLCTAGPYGANAWVSSYTGLPLPDAEMDEWLEASARRIERNRHARVLEIGAGSGALLFRIGSRCRDYCATDFCHTALETIRSRLDRLSTSDVIVRLLAQRADEVETLRGMSVDAVVLNSVVQYFPSAHYLLHVLEGVIDLVEDGGTVFLGDLRSLPLLPAFHASVVVHRASPELRLDDVDRRVSRAIDAESELALAPDLFLGLGDRFPRIRHVDVEPRRGTSRNELTNFRYDVTLHIGGPGSSVPDCAWLDWQRDGMSVERLMRVLDRERPELLGLRDVPNARVSAARAVLEWLGRNERPGTAGQLRALLDGRDEAGVDPEHLWRLEERFPYSVKLLWAGAADGRFDAMLTRRGTGRDGERYRFVAVPPTAGRGDQLSNCPTRPRRSERLAADLQALARARLPEYMIPSSFRVLPALPVTRNGKIDRQALGSLLPPAPGSPPGETEGPTEELLALIWAGVLGVSGVTTADHFFEQGGHSLLAVQLASRINEAFSIDLPVRAVFESPRLADLSKAVERLRLGPRSVPPPIDPAPRDGHLPLSFAQARLWFLEQLEPHNPFYNVPSAVRLLGKLDVAALSRALDEICRRHESLRTRFRSVDGQSVQVIDSSCELMMGLVDLEEVPSEDLDATVDRWIREDARHAFDLEQDRLIRATLLRLRADEHVLLLTVHHIVCDGWSMGILIRDIASAYEGSKPEELPVQYADYALWQRRCWSEDEATRQVAYWTTQLRGCATIELPCDRPRPARQTYRGSTEFLHVRQSLVERLDVMGRRNGATLFMTLLALFKALLCRYTGQSDLVVGTPVANRDQRGIEDLVGFFANTLVLRTDLSGNPSFVELLRRVRKVALDAYDHRAVPFEEVVRVLRPERDLSRSPLFQVWFTLLGLDLGEVQLPDLRLVPMDITGETSKFDLSLSVIQTAGGLQCCWEYNTDLFERETVRRMAEHFHRVAEAVAGDPLCRIAALPVPEETERERTLVEWNQTAHAGVPWRSLVEWFDHHAKQSAGRTAVVFGTRRMTYGEVDRRAARLAGRLRKCGIEPGQPVAICMDRGVDLLVAIVGILEAGGALVPLDPTYPAERLRYLLQDCGAALVVVHGDVPADLSGLDVRFIDVSDAGMPDGEEPGPGPSLDGDQTAYIMYTSGSTGRPKGVRVPHVAVLNLLAAMAETLDVTADDRWLAVTSLSFDISMLEILLPIMVGGTVVLADRDTAGDGERLATLLADSGATILQATPSVWRTLIESSWAGDPALTMISGGEALPSGLARALLPRGRRLFNAYGPTETTIWSTIHVVSADGLSAGATRTAAIGRPLWNTRCYVLDRSWNPVPVGAAGELFIAGAGVAEGYHDRATLTAESFLPDPFTGTPGARMYRTGDLVRYQQDGNIEFLGRRDDQVKIRGVRIEPAEIEAVLGQHGSVKEAVVVAADGALGPRLRAFVVSHRDPAASVDELRSYLRRHFPQFLVPTEFVALAELPRTASGKIDRRVLKASAAATPRSPGPHVPPGTETERRLIRICADVFQRELVGIHDDFFEGLGGHSLTAIRLVSRARAAFGFDVPVRWVFEARDVASLATRIDAARARPERVPAGDRVPAAVGSAAGSIPLSSIQQRIWFLSQVDPAVPLFHIPFAVRIHGPLDVPALTRALEDVTQRHELLRATFPASDGWPTQVIGARANVAWSRVDLSALSHADREREAARYLRLAASRPFALSRESPLHADLIRLAADDHLALVTMHHIAADGWSVRLLARDLLRFYRHRADGAGAAVPRQVAQYAACAAAEPESDADGRGLAYWRERLAEPSILQLSTDRARPAEQSSRGARVAIRLDRALTQSLRRLARDHDTTLFAALLTAWSALLSRYTGQHDVLVGSPISMRNRQEFEDVIGPLINTIVLRVDLTGDPPAGDLMDRVKDRVLEGIEHADVPFQRIVDALRPQRTLSSSPLYQVMFSFDEEIERLTVPDLEIECVEVETGAAQCDLALTLQATDEGVHGSLEYRTDLFEASTIRRVARHVETLLASLVENPGCRVSELAMLPADEVEFLHDAGSPTTGWSSPEASLIELFEQQAACTPTLTAAAFDDRRISYDELNQRSNQLARHLQSGGAAPGTVVGMLLERSLDALIGILAIWKTGAIYLPLDPGHPQQHLQFILEDSDSGLVLTRTDVVAACPLQVRHHLCLDAEATSIAQQPKENIGTAPSRSSAACHLYTSGSTGQPKAVVLLHRNLSSVMLASRELVGLAPGDVMPAIASLGFDISLFELFHPLLAGATARILRQADVLNPVVLTRSLETVTVFHAVPSLMQAILDDMHAHDADGQRHGGVRRIFVGGELVPPSLLNDIRRMFPRAQVRVFYGPTEGSIICSTYAVPSAHATPRHFIGRPLEHAVVRVCDAQGRLVPIGVPGEIILGGDAVAAGYVNRPQETGSRFFTVGDERFYRTGDLGRWNPDANLEFLGRIDRQVKIRGHRVEPADVESALAALPGVRQAVVEVRTASTGDRQLVAYLVSEPQALSSPGVVRAQLRAVLPDYMVPSAFVTIDALPLLASGKPDRAALRELPMTRASVATSWVPPSTPLERMIAAAWKDLLDIEAVGLDDNLFDLGANSLLLMRLQSRLQSELDRELTVVDLFRHPTVRLLALSLGGEPPVAPDTTVERVSLRQRLTGRLQERRLAAREWSGSEDRS